MYYLLMPSGANRPTCIVPNFKGVFDCDVIRMIDLLTRTTVRTNLEDKLITCKRTYKIIRPAFGRLCQVIVCTSN